MARFGLKHVSGTNRRPDKQAQIMICVHRRTTGDARERIGRLSVERIEAVAIRRMTSPCEWHPSRRR